MGAQKKVKIQELNKEYGGICHRGVETKHYLHHT